MTLADSLFEMLHEANRLRLPATGMPGLKRADQLPHGWVQVTFYPFEYSDETTHYYGPVLRRDEHTIRIEVAGEGMTFPLDRADIVEGTA